MGGVMQSTFTTLKSGTLEGKSGLIENHVRFWMLVHLPVWAQGKVHHPWALFHDTVVLMDHMQKNGVNNAHHVLGVVTVLGCQWDFTRNS